MSLFGLSKQLKRFGAIIDIGSGSVLVSIVCSDPKLSHPQIVWSHRERAPLKNIDSLEQSAKAVVTTLFNSSMMLDAEGRQVLNNFEPGAQLSEMQCSISAPWSYTITKTINYSQKEKFVITNELIEELYKAIDDKVNNQLKQTETLQNLGLQTITNLTTNLSANGYRIENPENNLSNDLTISQTTAVTQQYLIDAILELQQKLFPKTKSSKLSFILVLYSVLSEVLENKRDVCLVDVTFEATEIGIVRDGVLTYCTHTPFGSFSLAREIAEITAVPINEAFGYIHTDDPFAFVKTLTKQQQASIDELFESYTEQVSNLFKETGDSLSIPKLISLHTDINSEPLFTELLRKAAVRNLKTQPTITPINKQIIHKFYSEQTKDTPLDIPADTALLLSAQFFHNKMAKQASYEYF